MNLLPPDPAVVSPGLLLGVVLNMGDVRRVEAAVGDVMATSGNRRFLPDPLLLEDEVEEGGEGLCC